MFSHISEQEKFKLLKLLTEVSGILMAIEKKLKSDQSQLKEQKKEQLQETLKSIPDNQNIDMDCLMDTLSEYVCVLSEVHGEKVPLREFGGGQFTSGKEIEDISCQKISGVHEKNKVSPS